MLAEQGGELGGGLLPSGLYGRTSLPRPLMRRATANP